MVMAYETSPQLHAIILDARLTQLAVTQLTACSVLFLELRTALCSGSKTT